MGRGEQRNLIPFTREHLKDRELVIKMLKYEDSIIHGEEGDKIYREIFSGATTSFDPEFTINRMTLSHFDFDTSNQSVKNYRGICGQYYRGPTDYDEEVLNCITYLRENKCLYFTLPEVNVGDKLPDVPLFEADGETKTTLYNVIERDQRSMTVVGAFSGS